MKPISIFGRLHDGLTDAGFLISTLCLAIMVVIYCAEVVGRYFLNHPLDWANDAFSNLLCITLFSMVPHATRGTSHIEINLVPEFFPNAVPPLKVLVNLTGFAICALISWMSLAENIRQIAMGILTEQNHPVPVWWISIFITYGFASSALYFLRALLPVRALRPRSFLTTLEPAKSGGAR
ncbi:MAG: TRAP transporter small permease [Rhizobiales bacterium]|nr:TRAP transporter small permease [Hyphomicrobiales bacterium]